MVGARQPPEARRPPDAGWLTDSVARIRVSGEQGTGFFVSPRLLVTAAHVVTKNAIGSRVAVSFRGASFEAAVIGKRADEEDVPQLSPFPDIALLQFDTDVAGSQPLALTDAVPKIGERIYSCGFPAKGESGEDCAATVEGKRYVTHDNARFRIKLKAGEFKPGMSGAPAVLADGCVAGVVTLTRGDGKDLGGYFTPTHELQRAFESIAAFVVAIPGAAEIEAYRTFVQADYRNIRIPKLGANPAERSSLRKLYVDRILIPAPETREPGGASDAPVHRSGRSIGALLAEPAPLRAVITGEAGDGKSTLLGRLMLAWAEGESERMPLLVELRMLAAERPPVADLFDHLENGKSQLPRTAVQARLRDGSAMLLFDALDEVLDTTARPAVVDAIVALARRYPQAPIILTTRAAGYLGSDAALALESAGFRHFSLESFQPAQTAEFLNRWYAPADGAAAAPQVKAELLVRAISDSPSVRQLAAKPLLLMMMARVGHAASRVKLYAQFIALYIRDWDVIRGIKQQTQARLEVKLAVLEDIAHAMSGDGPRPARNEISLEDLRATMLDSLRRHGVPNPLGEIDVLLEAFAERDAILAPIGNERYAFGLQTFFEYFLARSICAAAPNAADTEALCAVLRNRWTDPAWDEVIRLICGIAQKRAAPLIRELLANRHDEGGWRAVFLAADGLEEADLGDAGAELSAAVMEQLALLLRYELPFACDPQDPGFGVVAAIRVGAATRLVRRPSDRLRAQLESTVSDPDIASAVAILPVVVSTWTDEATRTWLHQLCAREGLREIREAATRAIARYFPDDDTHAWLLATLQSDRDPVVRYAAISELTERWPDEDLRSALSHCARRDPDEYVRIEALRCLTWLTPTAALFDRLLDEAQTANSWRVRNAALGAVASISTDERVRRLAADRAAIDPRWTGRQTALTALRNWPDEDTRRLFLERAARDANAMVRATAFSLVKQLWPDHDVTPLATIAGSESDRSARLMMLRWFPFAGEDAVVLAQMTDRARHAADPALRQFAIEQLTVRHGADTLSPILREIAETDPLPDIRSYCLMLVAVGARGDAIGEWLVERAERETDPQARSTAVYHLVRRYPPPSRAWLQDIVDRDGWESCGRIAISALARRWPDDETRRWLEARLTPERSVPTVRFPALAGSLSRQEYRDSCGQLAIAELGRAWTNARTREHLASIACASRIPLATEAIRVSAFFWPDERTTVWLKELCRAGVAPEVEAAASEALTYRRRTQDIRAFVIDQAVRNDRDLVRSAALSALARQWREPSTCELVMQRAISDPSRRVRYAALRTLAATWDDDDAYAFVNARLADENGPALSASGGTFVDVAARQAVIQELCRW